MKQERIIYIAYTIMYFIAGIIFLSAAIISTKTLFSTSILLGIVMIPFMIIFDIGVVMIFLETIRTALKVISSYTSFKPLLDIQEKIMKLNNFIKQLPKNLRKIFKIAFGFYWFLFIVIAAILWIKEKNDSSLLFLVPFIGAGLFMFKMSISSK